ncbi:MAG: D-amino-acid transaminase [Acidiferrobacterales bacterium]|jgi:D-alanine transaminase|nr:D-amino-acid transaminase [Acidiferrobacterales bacterium]
MKQKISRVYLNGDYVDANEAKVSAFDRGFIFGDGVYEVIPVYGGRPFRLPQHLSRLKASLAAIMIANPLTDAQWTGIIDELVQDAGKTDQAIYLQVTRGAAPRDHAFPADTEPTVFAYSKPMTYPGPAEIENGVGAITTADIRWRRCDIKAIALLANVVLRQQAIAQGKAEAILVHDGHITEGAASNIFIVKDNVIYTAAKSEQILPGITRDLVVELAQQNDIDCREMSITEQQLRDADEVWLTSSMKEILPIVEIDGIRVGNGKRGPMHQRVFELLQAYKDDFRAGTVD